MTNKKQKYNLPQQLEESAFSKSEANENTKAPMSSEDASLAAVDDRIDQSSSEIVDAFMESTKRRVNEEDRKGKI